MRPLLLVCCGCILASILLVANLSLSGKQIPSPEDHRHQLSSIDKPPIYTFYEKTQADKFRPVSQEDELLALWSSYWSKAGWTPRILTLADAQAHPDYETMKSILESKPDITEASRYTFYRWLAVAQAGGGWFAEKDSFPLHRFADEGFKLPQNGALTTWERFVPSLVSGSKEEWERVARELMNAVRESSQARDHTDKTTLEENIRNRKVSILQRMGVLTGPRQLLKDHPRDTDECEKMGGHKAVHFCWKDISRGKRETHRPGKVRAFYDLWDYSCKPEHTALR